MSYTLEADVLVKIIAYYETADGKLPFRIWLYSLRDKSTVARIRIRLSRVQLGNFGDSHSVGKGVSELRLAFGSGFRIYYGIHEEKIVVLLMGGDKSSQAKDIKIAHLYWQDYLKRF